MKKFMQNHFPYWIKATFLPFASTFFSHFSSIAWRFYIAYINLTSNITIGSGNCNFPGKARITSITELITRIDCSITSRRKSSFTVEFKKGILLSFLSQFSIFYTDNKQSLTFCSKLIYTNLRSKGYPSNCLANSPILFIKKKKLSL